MHRTILAVLTVFAIFLLPFPAVLHAASETAIPVHSADKQDSSVAPATSASPTPTQTPSASSGTAGAVDITPPVEGHLIQKASSLKPAELPEAIKNILELPGKDMQTLVDKGRVVPTGRPEVLVSGERAGFQRYYEEGRGFKVTDIFSISGRVELVEDDIPIDSLMLAAKEKELRNLVNMGLPETMTDTEIRNSYTRAVGATVIAKFKDDWPVLRYTMDHRQSFRAYDDELNEFKDFRQTTMEYFIEYAIPYKLPLLGRWILNAGYSRINQRGWNNRASDEKRNKWTFNNAFQIDKEREIFFGYEYFVGKHTKAPWMLKPDQHLFAFQWRQRFPDWRLFSVTNYTATRENFNPDVAQYTKHEIFQEFNKDITQRLRTTQRTTFIQSKVANSNFIPSKVSANGIVGSLKLSYEIFKDIDVSATYQQSWGLTMSLYDNCLFQWDLAIFKPGLLRTSFGVYVARYYNACKTESGIQFKSFLFQ